MPYHRRTIPYYTLRCLEGADAGAGAGADADARFERPHLRTARLLPLAHLIRQ